MVLLDTGLGLQNGSVLGKSLELVHRSPLQITDVLITHAHTDHVGGLVDSAGRSAFPRATIHMSANEWRFMQSQPDTRDMANTIRAQVRPFAPGAVVVPGIRSRALYGHTPGHTMYELASEGDTLLDIGDAAHSSVVSLARPGWTLAWDSDTALGARQRRTEFLRLATSHERFFAVHFPFPGVGYVARQAQGFTFTPSLPRGTRAR